MGAGELFSEEDVGDGGGACSHVESLDRCRGLVDVRVLLSEEDAGVGGGARGPVARWEARVERCDLVGVREADTGCAAHLSHLLVFTGERRYLWRSSGARNILVNHE